MTEYTWGSKFICKHLDNGLYDRLAQCMDDEEDGEKWCEFASNATDALNTKERLLNRFEGQTLRIKALGKNIDDLLDDREVLVATLRKVRELAVGLELTDRVMAILRHIDTAPLQSLNKGEDK